jgi:hypothetical protein
VKVEAIFVLGDWHLAVARARPTDGLAQLQPLGGSRLQNRNQNAMFCMRRCAARRESRAEFIREIAGINEHCQRSSAMAPPAQ